MLRGLLLYYALQFLEFKLDLTNIIKRTYFKFFPILCETFQTLHTPFHAKRDVRMMQRIKTFISLINTFLDLISYVRLFHSNKLFLQLPRHSHIPCTNWPPRVLSKKCLLPIFTTRLIFIVTLNTCCN